MSARPAPPSGALSGGRVLLLLGSILQAVAIVVVLVALPGFVAGPYGWLLGFAAAGAVCGFLAQLAAGSGNTRSAVVQGLLASILSLGQPILLLGTILCYVSPEARRPRPKLPGALPAWSRVRAPFAAFAILVLAWEIANRFAQHPSFLFPSPLQVAESLVHLARSGQLAPAVQLTVTRLGFSFLISLSLGVSLASLLVLSPRLKRGVQPFLLGFQSLPGLAWIPVAILWFGFTETAIYFVTVIGSVFAITIGFVDAFATVPPLYAKAARNMGVGGARLLVRVTIPAATPHLVTSAKVGWSFAWRSLVGAEIVFLSLGGLGFLLQQGREFLNVAQVFATMVMVLVIGMVFERLLFTNLERAVRRRWGLVDER